LTFGISAGVAILGFCFFFFLNLISLIFFGNQPSVT